MAARKSRSIKPKEKVKGADTLRQKILDMVDESVEASRSTLTDDDLPYVDVPDDKDPFGVKETEEDLTFLYGKRHPDNVNDNATQLPQPVVDLLGRPLRDLPPALVSSELPPSNLPVVVPALASPEYAANIRKERATTKMSEAGEGPKHRVALIRDHVISYPDLFLDVFIQGPRAEVLPFYSMFARARCTKADSPEKADLVVFAGGVDVDPALYGHGGDLRHPKTERTDEARDTEDINLYLKCLELGIPMLGVCRGAQFLHVMNGGQLYQHVDNHHGPHSMWDVKKQVRIEKVSSVHHQMVRPNTVNGMQVIATANKARNRWRDPQNNDMGTQADIEAFFYRDTCCIGIQGHPEYSGYPQFTTWALDLINELVSCNPDVTLRDGCRRLKTDLMEQRNAKLRSEVKNRNVKGLN